LKKRRVQNERKIACRNMARNEDIKKEYKKDRKQQNMAKMKSYNVKQLYG
jgi:hypothetical protein